MKYLAFYCGIHHGEIDGNLVIQVNESDAALTPEEKSALAEYFTRHKDCPVTMSGLRRMGVIVPIEEPPS